MSPLSRRITSHLQKVVGLQLLDVSLFCFEYEKDPVKMEDLPFYFGGEVILNFDSERVVVTWDENAGWADRFSLYAGSERLYLPTSLIEWNVSGLNPWRYCISHNLISAQVYGQNDTPHIIRFDFDSTKIFVGDSSEMRLGDGDDLLIATELSPSFSDEWEIMWEA